MTMLLDDVPHTLLDDVPPTARLDESRPSKAAFGKSGAIGIVADPYDNLLAAIEELAPAITARVTEIEAGRRLPPDLVERLRSIGMFRMFAPRGHGGMELDLPRGLRIIETLSRIDGSVGWLAMIGSGAAIMAPLVSRDLYDEIYRNGPDVIFGGSTQPAGSAESVDGDWRVNGRWPFASGCQHADWLFALCVMKKDGKPLPGAAEGMPMLRGCVLPSSAWRIEDTWHVSGLKGTGSHHIVLEDVPVPADHFVDLINGKSCVPGPLYGAMQQFIPLMHSAFDLGMAAAALSELVELANSGWQQQRSTKPLRESDIFQYELGRIEADLRAAQALFQVQSAGHWRHALAGTLKTEALLTEATQSAVWISAACNRVGDACFALGGGTAIYDSSPLQRRMRDLHAAAQHAAVQTRHYLGAGALLVGQAAHSPKMGE
jgi:alkylation response protein AidB-like acyl-CoA dehydrogenase